MNPKEEDLKPLNALLLLFIILTVLYTVIKHFCFGDTEECNSMKISGCTIPEGANVNIRNERGKIHFNSEEYYGRKLEIKECALWIDGKWVKNLNQKKKQ